MMVVSLYIKISLIIFVPVFLIVALRQKYSFKNYLWAFSFSLIFIALTTLPFSQGEPFGWLINLYKTKILGQQLQIITANAFNIWTTISGIDEKPQTLPFLGLTYQYWGYILFAVFYLPLLRMVWKKQDIKTVFASLALTAFSSWMFLTNMHERYLFPLFPYLTALVSMGLFSIYPYLLITIISLLNLYNFWWYPQITPLVSFLSMGNRVVPRILGFVNLVLISILYLKLFLNPRRTT